MKSKGNLNNFAIFVLLLLSLIWSFNLVLIKLIGNNIPPIESAFLRSVFSSFFLFIFMKIKGIPVFHSWDIMKYGILSGIFFGSEFTFIYLGLHFTTVSASSIFLYTSPFFVAIFAHIFLENDNLNIKKIIGLFLAF